MPDTGMSAIVNFEAIGNLVKSWVLGEDRLKIPGKKWTKPQSTTTKAEIDALRQQFKDAGTNFTIPNTVTEVKVVQGSPTCFVLKLPDPDLLRQHEGRLKAVPYPMPPFYMPACNNPPISLSDKLRLDARRIGDYTISNCAGGP
ncbi:MAG: hypothetical protein U1E21_00330 [Reyranellaceae bacterium]